MSLSKLRIRFGKSEDATEINAKQAGQIIVIFALMLTVLIGLVGIAIDVTYAWRNGLQIQRAADAAAMAGVVYLPGNFNTSSPSAFSTATVVATDNGYGSGLTIAPNPLNDHQLDVTITAPVPTFFVRLFGINNWTVTRSARAAFVMPVPMGSPLAYYGVGCFVLTSPATTPPCSVPANNGVGLSGVTDGATTFTNLGGWGAIITKGGNQNNGDAYAPANNLGGNPPYNPTYNASYDPHGYYYTVSLPSAGSIKIFDPGFCAMGSASAGNYGAGDHWIGPDSNNNNAHSPVSTYYKLYDTMGQPLNPHAWQPVLGADSGSTFENLKGSDTANGGPANGGAYSTAACDAYHNKWYALPNASNLTGTFELQVYTTHLDSAGNPDNPAINQFTNAENMFSIEATGVGATVYGQSRMAVYNNMAGSAAGQQFYMAKIDAASGVGKSLAIDLFDPGDVGGNAFLQIYSPSGAGGTQFQVTNFTYKTDGNCGLHGNSDACGGPIGPRSQIQTANGGSSSFQSTWIHILVPLENSVHGDYGSTGLWQGGWWQVKYITGAANDTTTWSVNVVGNPVHLVPIG